MLAKQVVNIPFGVGIDEKTQTDLVDPGQSLLSLTNLRINKTGSYSKRRGYDSLLKLNGNAKKLGALNATPFVVTDYMVQNYSEQLGFVPLGQIPQCVATRKPIIDYESSHVVVTSPSRETNHDIAYTNNVIVVATGAQFIAYDATTGAVLIKNSSTAGTMIRCCAVGDYIVIAYAVPPSSGAGTSIVRRYLDTNNVAAGFSAQATIVPSPQAILYETTNQKLQYFDICAVDSTHYAIAYPTTGTGVFGIATFTPTSTTASAGVVSTISGSVAGSTLSAALACKIGDVLWFAFSGRLVGGIAYVGAKALNPTTLATVSAANSTVLNTGSGVPGAQTNIGIVPTTTRHCIVLACNPNNDELMVTSYERLDGSGASVVIESGAGPTQTNIWRYQLCGKPFSHDDRYYAPMLARCTLEEFGLIVADTEPTIELVDVTPIVTINTGVVKKPRAIATVAPRLMSVNGTPMAAVSTVAISDDKFISLGTIKRTGISSAIELITFDMANPNNGQTDQMADFSVLSGGVPSVFDAQAVTELSFTRYPEYVLVTTQVAPGSLNGTYQYTAIYEWTTNSGEIVRSAPAVPQMSENLVNNETAIRVPTLQLTEKDLFGPGAEFNDENAWPRIVLYRTVAGGTTFYRLDSTPNIGSHGVGQNVVVVTDNNASDISGNEPLYLQPGEPGAALPRVCPPSSTSMVLHRNRVWFVGDDQTTVYYSGQFVNGEQPWFSDAFTIEVPKGGPITALASMDGVLYIFKRDYIFSVTGDGPADNGSGNDLSTPEEIDVEVGCIEPRSVGNTPGGVFYQSPQGIYMLSRARSVSYAGQNVESTTDSFPQIVSTNVVDGEGCIYFECVPPSGGPDGYTIVFDYVHNQWMRDIKTSTAEGFPRIGASGAISINGVYYWITPDGQFSRQTDTYFDNGNWVTGQVDTSWIKMNGIQGYQRIWSAQVLMEKDEGSEDRSYGIQVRLKRDYSEVFQTLDWADSEMDDLSVNGRQQIQCNPKIQKMESLGMTMLDVAPTHGDSDGRGPTWIGLSLEVGVKQGTDKLPAANSK